MAAIDALSSAALLRSARMVRMNTSPDNALLVVNLGTPESPTAPAVRRYLAEFLSDRRVVAIPPLFWKPLLYGVILPIRGPSRPRNTPRSGCRTARRWRCTRAAWPRA